MNQLKEKILTLRQQGKTYRKIQNTLHCSKSIIHHYCKSLPNHQILVKHNHQIYLSDKNVPKEIVSTWDTKTKNLIQCLYEYGILCTEIADVLNLKVQNIRFYCKPLTIKFHYSTSYDKVKHRRKKLKLLAIIFKGGKCQQCGYSKCVRALNFHHHNPNEKAFTIAHKMNTSWKRIKQEIQSCSLLCSNCHSEKHTLDGDHNDYWRDRIRTCIEN